MYLKKSKNNKTQAELIYISQMDIMIEKKAIQKR